MSAPPSTAGTETPAPSLSHVVYVPLSQKQKREKGRRSQGDEQSVAADPSTLRIPFFNADQALAGKRALDVDREVNMDLVERETSLEGAVLVV